MYFFKYLSSVIKYIWKKNIFNIHFIPYMKCVLCVFLKTNLSLFLVPTLDFTLQMFDCMCV